MWRKSWSYKNIHGPTGNGECSKRTLLPDERSVWDDYLDLAALSPVKGQVCYSKSVGLTPAQISVVLKTPVEIIERSNRHMEELGMVTIDNNGIVIINNWKNYQSEYERLKTYKGTDESTDEGTGRGTSKRRIDIDKKYKRKEYKDIYIQVFKVWNDKKIIQHKLFTDECYGSLNTRLDHGYTAAELTQAINNYALILKSPKYFWTHRWSFIEFIRRGLDKFMDLEAAKKAYLDRHREDPEIARFK